MKRISLVALIIIIVDQIIKVLVTTNITLHSTVEIIKNFFSLTFIKNYGAAWSILNGNRIFLILIAVTALIFIYFLFIKNKKHNMFETVTYGLLVGGVIGNLIDRVIYGYVIDYLEFVIVKYQFPIFNLADICIVVAALLVIFIFWKEEMRCKQLTQNKPI